MKTFSVTLPFAGAFCVELKAESEEVAKDLALQLPIRLNPTLGPMDDVEVEYFDIHGYYGWDTMSEIVQGNVLHAPVNEVEVEEVEGEEEEGGEG